MKLEGNLSKKHNLTTLGINKNNSANNNINDIKQNQIICFLDENTLEIKLLTKLMLEENFFKVNGK